MKSVMIHVKVAMEMVIKYIIIALVVLKIIFFNQKYQIIQIVFLNANIIFIIQLMEIINVQITIIALIKLILLLKKIINM